MKTNINNASNINTNAANTRNQIRGCAVRDIKMKSKYKTDYKKVNQYKSFKKEIYNDCIDKLASGKKLDDKYYNHFIRSSGNKYYGLYCFHAAPNLVVIYGLEENELILHRIGSHSDVELGC